MSAGRVIGVAFLFGYFLFTPGILPYALRASCAVCTRSCACVATQRESHSHSEGARKPLLWIDKVKVKKRLFRAIDPTGREILIACPRGYEKSRF